MSSYAWLTDIHLNIFGDPDVVGDKKTVQLCDKIQATNCDAVFITGDISIAKTLVYHLSVIEREIQRPIYFVLGNHDYWTSTTDIVHANMGELEKISPFLKYLGRHSYMPITSTTAVLGHGCWYDANYGDYKQSSMMNDWKNMGDFANKKSLEDVVSVSRKLAHAGVTHISDAIKAATRYYNNLVILTHVPPFPQCVEGSKSQMEQLPWYVNKMCGDMLLSAAKAYPNVKFTVLTGHVHDRTSMFESKFAPNLLVKTGIATYGNPVVQQIIGLP